MRLRLLLLILLPLCFAEAQEKPRITVYTYHQKPPLIVNQQKQQGLYYDFCRYLNKKSHLYWFQLVSVPKKRIELMLEKDRLNGIILGVSPIWFKDIEETKYLWSSKIFTDQDEVISLASSPVEYNDQNSLQGKVFGGVRGFYYYGINELVNENKIARVNTANEVDLFRMLLNKRIDSAIVSRSTFNYVVKQNSWQDKFYLSKRPHDIFDRRVLTPKKYSELYQHIEPLIDNLQFDSSWKELILQYQ